MGKKQELTPEQKALQETTEAIKQNTITLEHLKSNPEMMARLQQSMENNEIEQSKIWILSEKLFPSDDRTLNFATELSDKAEVAHMNKLTTLADMMRLHFIPENMPENWANEIERVISKIDRMVITHKLNKTSYKRRRALELVHAVKNDLSGVTGSIERNIKGAFPK